MCKTCWTKLWLSPNMPSLSSGSRCCIVWSAIVAGDIIPAWHQVFTFMGRNYEIAFWFFLPWTRISLINDVSYENLPSIWILLKRPLNSSLLWVASLLGAITLRPCFCCGSFLVVISTCIVRLIFTLCHILINATVPALTKSKESF